MWVQDSEVNDMSALDGRRVGRVQGIITVIDDSRRDSKGVPVHYTGAFIELLHLRHSGRVHSVHGIVEVEDWPRICT